MVYTTLHNLKYMYQGNWKCSSCNGAITELPFQPRSESGLTCRACYGKQKNKDAEFVPEIIAASEAPDMPDFAELASEPAPSSDFYMDVSPVTSEQATGAGWKCSLCNTAITSLPFTPRSTNNLKCIDCFKKSRQ